MMSANKLGSSFVRRSIVGRHTYVTHPAAKVNGHETVPEQEAKITRHPSGMLITSLENYAPVSKVALYVKAGSRYETSDSLGITHALRRFAGLATQNSSAFGVTRNLQQVGAHFQTTTSREHLVYSVDCLRDKLDVAVKYLSEIALKPAFKPWEVSDNAVRMKLDNAMRDMCPATNVLDMLHKAAYRTGLGNSIYSPDYMVGKHTPEMLKSYVSKQFKSQNMCLVGMGIEHEELVRYADQSFASNTDAESDLPPSSYHGGELRIDGVGDLAYVAIATEGATVKTKKEMLSLAVLQQILGTGAHIKWGSNGSNRLAKAAAQASSNPHAVSCINVNYSDSGLFGVYIAAQASDIDKVIKAVVAETSGITKQKLTDQEVKTAKRQLKSAIYFGLENYDNKLDELAMESFSNETALEDTIKAIDSLTTSEVISVAKKVITGKPSMAAAGNLSNTPYLDQL